MDEKIVKILSKLPKEILIHCAEVLIFKMEPKSEPEWIRFSDAKSKYYEFSNFYKHKKPIIIDGEMYRTTEHYFQAQKYAEDIGQNLEYMKLIKKQNTGGQAKMLAGPITGNCRWTWQKILKELREEYEDSIYFDPVEWNKKRDDIMLKALIAKFTQDEHCKKVLLSTGDAILSEYSKKDHYWGNSGNATKIGRLGELLMQVRDMINN